MLKEFVEHYTEKKPNGRKEKWEMEKTFDYNLRLQYWSRKDYNGTYREHKEQLIKKEQDDYLKNAEENAYKPDDQRKMTMEYIKGIGKKHE